ncbi:receptor-like protein 56 isoform X1 [Cucumis sativus]|uniref:receptor-like protein 56 isoform X1 n=1 Tax=Cucumis sativus TaxID=3659 RepID=UPI0005EC59A6|nr:receptor-like protein 56 isoform X1 [Cucumis sativus]
MESKLMVKRLSLTLLLLLLIFVGELQVSNGCIEEERLSLLHMKSIFLSYDIPHVFHKSPFPSWVGSNCCNWERVKCDTSGIHVVELSLYELFSDEHYRGLDENYHLLNLSLFQNFKELKTLDLTYNAFNEITGNQGFNKFPNFNKLEILNLSGNYFRNKILSSLSGFTSLKKLLLNNNELNESITLLGFENLRELDLSMNRLNGTLQMQGLDGLEILNLEYNGFKNTNIFSSLRGLVSLRILKLNNNVDLGSTFPTQDVAKLKSLEVLDLSYDSFYDGVIPLQDLKNLKVLNLSYNQFNGSLPIQGFCKSKSLIELNIRNNEIRGEFPECIGNFTGLKLLDISSNQFSGKIPNATISKLTSIEYLSLYENDFEGSFSFSSLANHSNLWYFKLSRRNNTGNIQVETGVHEWHPTFQLQILSLRSCNLNSQTASKIPSFLLTQHKLKYLDLAHNNLVGPFPIWLLQNNSELNSLDLKNNSLSGTFQLSTSNLNLRFLEISSNLFNGQLPTHLGLLLPKVEYFNISRNSFEGNLPSSIKQIHSLRWLDVSNNKFSGNFQISTFYNMPLLQSLVLANNNFSGSIEGEWNLSFLTALDLSNNMFTGKIPRKNIGSSNLESIQLSRNRFVGELPKEICSPWLLTILDVSENQLVGEVPSTCLTSSTLVFLYLQKNGFTGLAAHVLLSKPTNLKIIDLSYNNFSGHIPKWFNKFTSLRVLLLKGNELEGPIPTQLCQNSEISIMDLSSNKLNGTIPSCFNNITFGNKNFGSTEVTTYPIVINEGLGDSCVCENHYIGMCCNPVSIPIIQVIVNFTTKQRLESYKGNILNYMSGLDLSSNQLTGDIPQQIGDLKHIRALNFSHNKLVGHVPKVLSNLKQLESLDLSNNFLNGSIPSDLATLNFLSTFNVSYNNLSGMIPTAPHFTYPESSFYGNPYLCGSYIEHKCSISPVLPTNNKFVKLEEDGAFFDLEAFGWSFAASYITLLLGFIVVLYINTQWRQRWFYFVEDCYHYFYKCT